MNSLKDIPPAIPSDPTAYAPMHRRQMQPVISLSEARSTSATAKIWRCSRSIVDRFTELLAAGVVASITAGKRMGATAIEVNASQVSLASHPDVITGLILEAARR